MANKKFWGNMGASLVALGTGLIVGGGISILLGSVFRSGGFRARAGFKTPGDYEYGANLGAREYLAERAAVTEFV